MREPQTCHQILTQHFFRRFFSNDSLPIPGDPESSVYRALSFCAIPALMFSVWLLPHYPNRPIWSAEADRYFFVLFSFIIMGTVATCEWEMLFPDRADFLILLPMPLKPRQLLYAKGRAVLSLIGLFLAATNFFSTLLFPAVSTGGHSNYLHTAWAHLAAVSLSGIFGAFSLLAIEGTLLCVLPSAWFRAVSTAMQTLSIALLLLLFLLYPLIAGRLQILIEGRASFAQYIPPLWFLGLYEKLMQGGSAPAGASALATIGIYATTAALLISLITYPLAWSRQKKRAIEGTSARVQGSSKFSVLVHRSLPRIPEQRAIFHFISQTIARSPRYRVFLALYAGAGLAMALCSVVTLSESSDHVLRPALSTPGLHTALPMLLFWLVTGLRASFAFPLDLSARWIFPVNLQLEPTVPFPGPCAKASRTWALLCCGALVCLILAILLALHWSYRDLLVQAVCGGSLSLLLTDLFFLGRTQIPFTRLRMPGLAVAFFLYVVFFPTVIQLTVRFEQASESNPGLLTRILLGTLALHLLFQYIDKLARQGIIGGFPEDEIDPGPQTLGLFQ
jgi:hypothetical protein